MKRKKKKKRTTKRTTAARLKQQRRPPTTNRRVGADASRKAPCSVADFRFRFVFARDRGGVST